MTTSLSERRSEAVAMWEIAEGRDHVTVKILRYV